jgi:hypothetical protein
MFAPKLFAPNSSSWIGHPEEHMLPRIFLGIAAMLLFSVSASNAFDNSNSVQLRTGQTWLTCRPALNRAERDPLAVTHILLEVNEKYEPTQLNVVHALFSGREFNRGAQYSNGGIWKTAGSNEWFWTGQRGPHFVMIGRVGISLRGWFYEEYLARDGRRSLVTSEVCFEDDDGARPGLNPS